MRLKWKIYYHDSVFEGTTLEEWIAAPDDGVQVVVIEAPWPEPPYPDRFETGWVSCARRDKQFYTGVDEYDPLGYGVKKFGSLLSDEDYFAIWDKAYGDA